MRRRTLLLVGLVLAVLLAGGAWSLLQDDVPGTAAGVVFEDLDGDGQRAEDEPGLSGVAVVVSSSSDGTSDRVETDEDGSWSSGDLEGPHTVSVDAATLPTRDGAEPSRTTEPGVYELDLAAGDTRSDVDFGFEWVSRDEAAVGGSAGGEDPEPEPEPADDPTTPPPTEEAAPADECDLVGTWDLREQPFLDQISAAASGAAPTSISAEHVGGNYLVELRGDGSYTATRDDWTFRIGAPQGAIRVTISSVDTGTWSATEDEISIAEPAGEADVDFAVEQGGQVVPLPIPPPETVGTDAIAGSGPYTCVGDVLEVTFEGVTSTLDRVG